MPMHTCGQLRVTTDSCSDCQPRCALAQVCALLNRLHSCSLPTTSVLSEGHEWCVLGIPLVIHPALVWSWKPEEAKEPEISKKQIYTNGQSVNAHLSLETDGNLFEQVWAAINAKSEGLI